MRARRTLSKLTREFQIEGAKRIQEDLENFRT